MQYGIYAVLLLRKDLCSRLVAYVKRTELMSNTLQRLRQSGVARSQQFACKVTSESETGLERSKPCRAADSYLRTKEESLRKARHGISLH